MSAPSAIASPAPRDASTATHPSSRAPVSNADRTPRHEDHDLRHASAELGMWIFLAGEVLFFGAVVVAYGIARLHSPQGFAAASAHTDVWLGTLNTALLLTSSFAVAVAAEASECQRPRDVAPWLWGAVLLGTLFLLVKGIEYRHEWNDGLFPGPSFHLPGDVSAAPQGAELFFAWYFVATGLHALHLTIGIALCAGFAVVSRSTKTDLTGAPRSRAAGSPRIHVVALYWHFVDLVWIVLYPLIYLVAPRS